MENLTETPVSKFNPNTLEEIRKELNLHQEGVLGEMIDNFEDWILKQNHFTRKKFDRRYLETLIIQSKGSLERAKNNLDKLCTMKTLMPLFFSKHNMKNELIDTSGFIIHCNMPKLLKNNYRLYIVKAVSTDFDSTMFFDFQRCFILMCEYVKFFDYSLGINLLIDTNNVNILHFVTKINILDLRNSMSILLEGYGMRIYGIHLISSSKSIDLIISLLKQVLSAKLVKRIHVHETMESLYEHIPQEFLPQEYGGEEKPFNEIFDNWVNVMSTEENVTLLKDICQAGTDEKLRLTANYNEHILGMPGSFRKLTVD